MKSLLSLILGVGLAVFLFICLLAGVTWALSMKGQHHFANLDEKPLWTSRPVRVDPASQSLVRLAAAPVPPAFQAMAVDIPEHEEAEIRMPPRQHRTSRASTTPSPAPSGPTG